MAVLCRRALARGASAWECVGRDHADDREAQSPRSCFWGIPLGKSKRSTWVCLGRPMPEAKRRGNLPRGVQTILGMACNRSLSDILDLHSSFPPLHRLTPPDCSARLCADPRLLSKLQHRVHKSLGSYQA